MKCRIFTTITMIFALVLTVGAQSFEKQWDQSNATGNRPEWVTGYVNRGIAATPEYVYIASRSEELNAEKKTIMYFDPKTGDLGGTLDVGIVSSSDFSVNDVEVSDDGQILVSNMAFYHEKWAAGGTWQFKIYKWKDKDAAPTVFIDYDNPEQLRLGDLITVKGNLTTNAVIYAAVHGQAKAVRWDVVAGVLNTTPEIIDLVGITEAANTLSYPKIVPAGVTKNDPFYYNSTGTALKKFSADGANILEVIDPINFLPSNGLYGKDNSITHFMVDGQSYIAAMGIQGIAPSQSSQNCPAEIIAVNVTNGLAAAKDPFHSQSLGEVLNVQLNGDITSTVIDDEVWVFILYSNAGFAAHKYIPSLPEVAVAVTENGWRRGSHPKLDSIDGRTSKPSWLNENSRAIAAGNGHIYVVNCAPAKGIGEILILDAADGSYLDKRLNVEPVNAANAHSELRISDVEVDDAGHILASNMRMGDAFNVFAWDNEDSEPYLLVSANGIPFEEENDPQAIWQQTAYYFDVKGDIKGDAVIVAARSNLKITYRWVIKSGVVQNEGKPTVVVNDVTTGLSRHFGPYASAALESNVPDSPVWVNGLSINPIRFAADGTTLGAIPDSIATNITQNVATTLVTKHFEWEGKKYLLEYNWVWADHVRLIDVSAEDLSTLNMDNQKEVGVYLGQEANPFKWGDVDYFIAEDGSLNIVTLVTNNGIRLDRYDGPKDYLRVDSTLTENYKIIHITESSVPQDIYVMEIDLTNTKLKLKTGLANDLVAYTDAGAIHYTQKETLSNMIDRRTNAGGTVVGGINADFFDMTQGRQFNITATDGVIASTGITSVPHSALYTDENGVPYIGLINMQHNMTISGAGNYAINGVNTVRWADNLILYNHFTGGETSFANPWGTEILLEPQDDPYLNGTHDYKVITKAATVTRTSDDQIIASGHGTAVDYLNKAVAGDIIQITTSFTGIENEKIYEMIGGWGHIVKNNLNTAVSAIAEEGSMIHEKERHPRSAVGYNQDKSKLYFVAADGRSDLSKGMNLKELANFMIDELGVWDGLNFDGGGSTTLMAGSETINNPSGGEQRAIANALLLVKEDATGITDILRTNDLSVYPNPVHNELFVSHPAGISQVEIVSLTGVVVKSIKNLDRGSIDVSMLKSGVYFVKVASKEKTIAVSKFIKH